MGKTTGKYELFNRDLSWLSFNYRVLEEAYDKELPLYERIKFLAIYSNNLEEFFQVRVSYYRSLLRTLPENDPKIKQVKPREIIQQINEVVSKQQEEFHELFYNTIIPELKSEGIVFLDRHSELKPSQYEYIKHIFMHQILSSVQPVLLVSKRIKPFLRTGHGYMALRLFATSKRVNRVPKTARPQYGLVKLPTDHDMSRFIELPRSGGKYYIMLLEDVIYLFLNKIFPGYKIDSAYSIKTTRDADLEYEEFEGEDLIEVIEELSSTRAIGDYTRFQFDGSMPRNMLQFFQQTFDIDREILVKGGPKHNFRDFFSFPNPLAPKLEHEKLQTVPSGGLEQGALIESISQRDYMLHFPYQSFQHFIDLLNESAKDSSVLEIFTTQYRAAQKSAVVDALINAAMNGKKVTVFVELKARFDEEANLLYAREMTQAGIRIFYSMPGLKVHSKIALIIRERGYKDLAFLGTGNFNEKTARLYGDHGFFTSDERIIGDLHKLVDYLQTRKNRFEYNHLLVPNINMVETYEKLIQKEIAEAEAGRKAYMVLKMNGLEDPRMIHNLYKASEKGVKIDLLVRGVCRLIPNKPYSKNIQVIRIIDRFLEHARVFYFYSGGKESIYLGSADWMRRNLYRRIECAFPIYDESIKSELKDILQIQLSDNVSARLIDARMNNVPIKSEGPQVRSQYAIYQYLKSKYTSE